MNINRLLFFGYVMISAGLQGIAPVNFFRPHDILLQSPRRPGSLFQFDVAYEGAIKSRSFQAIEDAPGNESKMKLDSVLKLWQCQQDTLAALKDLNPGQYNNFTELFREENDNREYGHYDLFADLRFHNVMLFGHWHLPRNFSLGLYLPVMTMSLEHLSVQRIANKVLPKTTDEDVLVPDLLGQVLKEGDLQWRNWRRTGLGDLEFLVEWAKDFPQARPLLKNVQPYFRIGMSFPTGKKSDQDLILAFPFGSDGGPGIIFGGGLKLWFSHNVCGVVDADFWHVFASTGNRRIRTNTAQTDLLFLQKLDLYQQVGFTQKFTLYLEHQRIVEGLSARIAYQYLKHLDDTLYLNSYVFSPRIANDAQSVQEWTAHNLVLSVKYDWWRDECTRYRPYLSFFYKLGFNGKRAVLCDSLGFTFGMNF